MQIRDVLTQAPNRHVSAFIERIGSLEPCHVEPAMRMSDGSLALAGNPPTPCRMDLVVKANGEQHTIDSERASQIDAHSIQVGDTTVQVEPFDWSMAHFDARGVGPEARELVRTWFVRWFDLDDENSADSSGLYGAVHYLGDIFCQFSTDRISASCGNAH